MLLMPTTKRRIPVTLNPDLDIFVESFAIRHRISRSRAIEQLVRYGMEQAEDEYLGVLADRLDSESKTFESHEAFWAKVKSLA